MKFRAALIAPVCVTFLSACGNLQTLKVADVPQPLKSAQVALSSSRPPPGVSPGAIEVPNHSVFLKQTAGGSVAVGLLLGPLGVMANASNIERLSKELAENSRVSSLFQLDALEEAATAWNEKPTQLDSKALQLRPYIVLYPDNNRKSVTIIGGVFVTSTYVLEGGKVWNADYHYVLPTPRAFEVLEKVMETEQLASVKDELKEGFRHIRNEVLRDLSPTQPNRRLAMIRADALKASLMGFAGFASGDIELDGSGRMVIRSNIDNWGGTVGAALRDTPHQVWIFSKPTQYQFDAEPEERKSR